MFGSQCQNKCACVNGGACDPVTGECTCMAGYMGKNCDQKCKVIIFLSFLSDLIMNFFFLNFALLTQGLYSP